MLTITPQMQSLHVLSHAMITLHLLHGHIFQSQLSMLQHELQ